MSNEYKQTLARFEQAVRDHAWMGAKHPSEHAHIEREYEEAKRALVTKLTYRQPRPDVTMAELDRLLDEAVSEGRLNWDGYYGHDNTYHMSSLRASQGYKALTVRLK